MSPKMLILLKLSPDIYHFLAEYCNFQKNIGPIEDSMTYLPSPDHTAYSIRANVISIKS